MICYYSQVSMICPPYLVLTEVFTKATSVTNFITGPCLSRHTRSIICGALFQGLQCYYQQSRATEGTLSSGQRIRVSGRVTRASSSAPPRPPVRAVPAPSGFHCTQLACVAPVSSPVGLGTEIPSRSATLTWEVVQSSRESYWEGTEELSVRK